MRHHGAGLLTLTKNHELVDALGTDFRSAKISVAEMAMLEYAAKLTSEPWSMEESDVCDLRDHGFSDAAILDICQITAYYAYVNRLADGLGVELEGFWREDGRE